jgi:hypothetical protein
LSIADISEIRLVMSLKKALENIGFKCRVWAHNEYALRIGLDRHGMLTCVKNREGLIR